MLRKPELDIESPAGPTTVGTDGKMLIFTTVSFRVGTPVSGYPSLSEANVKKYPLFLGAIQIGACKLYETL